jgi:hypothetical protein
MKPILKVFLLLIVIGVLFFIVYSCVTNSVSCKSQAINPAAPAIDEAPWKATVRATGNILYSKLIVTEGQKVGERVHTLKGVWELEKDVYIYKNVTVVLDEKYFGEVKTERRK